MYPLLWLAMGGAAVGAAEKSGLLGKLSWWRASLASMGASAPMTDWSQAPHVSPPPGPGFFEQMAGQYGPIVLLGLWAWSRVTRGR